MGCPGCTLETAASSSPIDWKGDEWMRSLCVDCHARYRPILEYIAQLEAQVLEKLRDWPSVSRQPM